MGKQRNNRKHFTKTRIKKRKMKDCTDNWALARRFTNARIGIGRAGSSIPTAEFLQFQWDHACAVDAVYSEIDMDSLEEQIGPLAPGCIQLDTVACDKKTYLQRPDYGRKLSDSSRRKLQNYWAGRPGPDILLVVEDGLSSAAVQRYAPQLLSVLLPLLQQAGLTIAPVFLVRYGRVALQDEIGSIAKATIAVSLIGERPGLGSSQRLGIYMVYKPCMGKTDAHRNCISNIGSQGHSCETAAETLIYLISESMRKKLSGVELKDNRSIAIDSSLTKLKPAQNQKSNIGLPNKKTPQ